jgi:hypothetical protein
MPTPSSTKRNIFLSYSRSDLTIAEQIRDIFVQAGRDAWLDQNEIRAGQEWWNVITTAIRKSDALVFLASRHSTASEFCRAELKYALALRRSVIPVIIDGLTPDELPDQLRSRHGLYYSGKGADKEVLLRAIADIETTALLDPLPPPPRLPAALPARSSAFLDSRFRADLEHIRQCIERQEWQMADERTRDAILGLSGLEALKRRYLKASSWRGVSEVLDLPCDALEALASIWSAADPPIDEDFREFPPYRTVRAKIEYPTVWVQRKAEVESPLFDEMDALEARCRDCDVELFFFYARSDGDLLFVPERILRRRLTELACPAATSLLRFCSFLLAFWTDYSIDQLALGSQLIDETVAAFLTKSSDPANGLRSLVQDLWSRNLVRNFDGTSFSSHQFVDKYLRSQMSEEASIQGRERVFQVLAYLTKRVPVGDHWLKTEIQRQLEVLSDRVLNVRRPSASEIAAIEVMRNWLQSA